MPIKRPLDTTDIAESPKDQICRAVAWILSLVVCLIAVVAWGISNAWQLVPYAAYRLFPLLGLLAFSLLWSHYIASMIRQLLKLKKIVLGRYFQLTSMAVLVLICLHPGLLIYQRFRDGFGLPPGSYMSYVMHGLGWVTLLGTASWFVFIAYEFHRVYGQRSWWHYVEKAGDIAMLAVFYHSLRLGTTMQLGWFHAIWWFYGLTLVVALLFKYRNFFIASKSFGVGQN